MDSVQKIQFCLCNLEQAFINQNTSFKWSFPLALQLQQIVD